MIFPVDVHRNIVNTKKLVGRDRTAVIIQLFLFANVCLFFLLRFIFRQVLQISIAFAWISQIIICIFAGIFIFRIFIFKEDEKIRESESSESDSFSKYLNIRKDSWYSHNVGRHTINLYEYTNGTSAGTICFKFGSNDNAKAANTARVLNQLYKLVADYGYELRTVMLPEKFENSREFKKYVADVNAVQDKVLGKTLREIADSSIQYSRERANVDALYITIRSNSTYQRGELESLFCAFYKILDENVTCFRDVSLLDMSELMEFYRDFSTVEAIDLTMTKALDMIDTLESDYAKVIGVYCYFSEEGRKFKNEKILQGAFHLNERRISND